MGSKILSLISPLAGFLGAVKGGKTSKVSTQPTSDTEAAARKAKKSRTALFETEGGVAGQELDPRSIAQRNTLLGN